MWSKPWTWRSRNRLLSPHLKNSQTVKLSRNKDYLYIHTVNKMFTLHFLPNAQNLYLERDSQNNLAVLSWNLHISFSDLPPKIQVQYSPNCNPKVEAIHGKVHITGLRITHRPIKKLIQTFINKSSPHVVRYSRKKPQTNKPQTKPLKDL